MADNQSTSASPGPAIAAPKHDAPPGLSPVKLPKAVLIALLLVWLAWVGFLASVAI